MTAPTPNAELAYRVLDHIDAHPEQWNQSSWCGTAQCFAGWATELSGERANASGEVGGMHVSARAAQLLGFADEPELNAVGLAAVHGGLAPDEEDEDALEWELFSACNSREDLGRLVAEIFGPRPAVVS